MKKITTFPAAACMRFLCRKTRPFLLAVVCLCAIAAQAQRLNSAAMRKLQLAEFAIARLYVDTVNENRLVEDAIAGMLGGLDPHSTYSDADEVKRMNEPLQGNFEGIGVQFQMMDDTLLVIQPVGGGPSEKAGILAGDRIVTANDSAISGVKMSTEEIMKRLRGPKGSTVRLGVVRRGVDGLLAFDVKRDKIPIHSIDAAYMIRPRTGYIRVNRFGATTGTEFKEAMKELRQKGMKDLVLDLQGNGGGYLSAAQELANEFLGQKELIVYTEGRASKLSELRANGKGSFRKGRLVILIDEYTASASEIVSGAVQDWDRGIIVGRRSFGKGLVQRPIDLPDGSMIRLTIARYYTPSGRCIQKPYDSKADYDRDLIERFNRGELAHADSIHFPDSLKTRTMKLKRTVYGGGGIMPDYFVPLDTAMYTDYHRNLVAKGAVTGCVSKYIDAHRKQLAERYKDFDTFDKQFEADAGLLASLQQLGEKAGVKRDEAQFRTSLPLIKTQLKALVARDLWDMDEYFRVMNTTSESVQKALEILSNGDYEKKLR